MSEPNTPIRRTKRTIKPSLKAKESEMIQKLANAGFVKDVLSDENFEEFTDDSYNNSDVEKPVILHENERVLGEDIFKFQVRKSKSNLAKKVLETCGEKTPFVLRTMTKNRIKKVIDEDSESEYEVSSEEESSSQNESTEEHESEEVPKLPQYNNKQLEIKESSLQIGSRRNRAKYVINSEEYFENCSSAKMKTSNNTLDKLETPRLPQYELQKILGKLKLTEEHEKSLKNLNKININYFKKWLFILNENFNILLYGLGSKRDILRKFHNEYLQSMPVIVVNGFFPTLTVKNILDSIITDLLEIKECPANVNEACDLIIQKFTMIESHLYLIIHNIEGEMLRSTKSQNVLAQLAAVKNIHLIASIDHINGPLIWDQKKLSKFNYIWYDVTCFLPYKEETSFEKSMMVQQTGTLALSSLRSVFLSLTTNSKSIYTLIAKHQLEHAKNQYYPGISFKDLYMACREAFIVSSDLALRAQLTEFLDHKMIKQKRSADGTEYLNIPLPTTLLQKFMDENSS